MKNLYLILISILICIFLTGCTYKQELHEYAYVVAMGIDKSQINPNNISVTFEFVIPINFTNDSNSQKTSTTITVDSPDIYNAINMANISISKQLNLSHNKIIVFSENLAHEGLEKYISTISNDKNFRTNMYILVSKCDAKDYIINTNALLEKNPSKFYELLLNDYRYSSYLANSYFLGHVLSGNSTYSQPIAALANLTFKDNIQPYNYMNFSTPNNLNYVAGSSPKSEIINSEILGLGIFKDSKLVGEITAEETAYYLMCTNSFKKIFYTVYSPLDTDTILSFELSTKSPTKINISIVDGQPFIQLDISLLANLISNDPNISYNSFPNSKELENELEYILKNKIETLLYKTAQQYESDIFSFGRSAAKNFTTWDKWNQYNWLDMYKYAYFDVNVNLKLQEYGLVIEK